MQTLKIPSWYKTLILDEEREEVGVTSYNLTLVRSDNFEMNARQLSEKI